jgi:glutathione S-transferase
MSVRLFSMPGSHAATTGQLLFDHKGINYKRTDLLPVVSWIVLKALRFPDVTVPAAKIDGERVQGTRAIARELERRKPEPSLFPDDAVRRRAVEEAERFGDEELQAPARRILWNALRRDRAPLRSFSAGARLGVPIDLAIKTAAPIVALAARFNEASDENVRADLAALPGMLQRIDDWIAEGVLGSAPPSAADLQIGASLALLLRFDDLRPLFEQRPCAELAERLFPDYPGHVPAGAIEVRVPVPA